MGAEELGSVVMPFREMYRTVHSFLEYTAASATNRARDCSRVLLNRCFIRRRVNEDALM